MKSYINMKFQKNGLAILQRENRNSIWYSRRFRDRPTTLNFVWLFLSPLTDVHRHTNRPQCRPFETHDPIRYTLRLSHITLLLDLIILLQDIVKSYATWKIDSLFKQTRCFVSSPPVKWHAKSIHPGAKSPSCFPLRFLSRLFFSGDKRICSCSDCFRIHMALFFFHLVYSFIHLAFKAQHPSWPQQRNHHLPHQLTSHRLLHTGTRVMQLSLPHRDVDKFSRGLRVPELVAHLDHQPRRIFARRHIFMRRHEKNRHLWGRGAIDVH